MPYHTFTAGTVGYAEEVMDNFYYIYQGDRMPYNTSFSLTADTNNIGSDSQRWRKVYSDEIECTDITTTAAIIKTYFNTSTSNPTTTVYDIPVTDKTVYGIRLYAEFSGSIASSNYILCTLNSITAATYSVVYSNVYGLNSSSHTSTGFDIAQYLRNFNTSTADTASTYYFSGEGRATFYGGQKSIIELYSTMYRASSGTLAVNMLSFHTECRLQATTTITAMNISFDDICTKYKLAIWELD